MVLYVVLKTLTTEELSHIIKDLIISNIFLHQSLQLPKDKLLISGFSWDMIGWLVHVTSLVVLGLAAGLDFLIVTDFFAAIDVISEVINE
jgi:hypothetical protein